MCLCVRVYCHVFWGKYEYVCCMCKRRGTDEEPRGKNVGKRTEGGIYAHEWDYLSDTSEYKILGFVSLGWGWVFKGVLLFFFLQYFSVFLSLSFSLLVVYMAVPFFSSFLGFCLVGKGGGCGRGAWLSMGLKKSKRNVKSVVWDC